MIMHNFEQGSEAWHQIKLGRFSGTTFKNLQSAKSTASYQDAIMNVVAQILTGEKEETFSNDIMQRGIDMEPEAADIYELAFDIETQKVGFCEPDEDVEYHDYVGVSPDRLVGDRGGLEIKCPKANTFFKYIKANILPSEYKWQVQGCLFVTGREWWDFMAYYPKLKPFIIRVYPDLEMHAKIDQEIIIAVEEVKRQIKLYKEFEVLDFDSDIHII